MSGLPSLCRLLRRQVGEIVRIADRILASLSDTPGLGLCTTLDRWRETCPRFT